MRLNTSAHVLEWTKSKSSLHPLGKAKLEFMWAKGS